MDFDLWRSFFSHYDFRAQRGLDPVRADGYYVVERSYTVDELRKDAAAPAGASPCPIPKGP